MVDIPEKPIILKTKVRILPSVKDPFAEWQAKIHATIATFPGFVSLEIISSGDPSEWVIVQRFYSSQSVLAWRESRKRKELMDELKKFVVNEDEIQDIETEANKLEGGVTEVFITEVGKDQDHAFRQWVARIHEVEAKFPGFRGMYIQSPTSGQGKNWITFLQFDTPENLDRWLASSERERVLNESKPLIAALETHRVISSYAGWFSSIAKKGRLPPVWKQTMLVLLVLFPIVMLELKFLSPLTKSFGSSLSTFIGNAISVTLISWPMMPIAILLLGWWASPEWGKRSKTIFGTFVVIAIYLLEILAFWML